MAWGLNRSPLRGSCRAISNPKEVIKHRPHLGWYLTLLHHPRKLRATRNLAELSRKRHRRRMSLHKRLNDHCNGRQFVLDVF